VLEYGPKLKKVRYRWCKVQHNDHQLNRGLQLGAARCSWASTGCNCGIHVRGCTDYFRHRFTKNEAFMQDPDRYFRKIMTEYMTKKAASVQLHHVRQYGTQELKFEVAPKDRA
jgi:hypothetical protein